MYYHTPEQRKISNCTEGKIKPRQSHAMFYPQVKNKVHLNLKITLAGSHSAQTKYQHHQAGLEMESTGDAEEREAKEQLATVNGGGDGRGRLQPATVGETVTRKREIERLL